MRGIKFLLIALCIFKVIDAAPAAQSTTPSTTPSQSPDPDPNLPITTNGTCGATVGTRCPDGTCCSARGFCGETPGKYPS